MSKNLVTSKHSWEVQLPSDYGSKRPAASGLRGIRESTDSPVTMTRRYLWYRDSELAIRKPHPGALCPVAALRAPGLLLVAAYYTVLFLWESGCGRSAGLPGFGAGMEHVTRFPVWYRIVAVVGAGIGEEILFRGVQRHANRDAHQEHPTRSRRHTHRIPSAACAPMGVGFCARGPGQRRWRHGVLFLA